MRNIKTVFFLFFLLPFSATILAQSGAPNNWHHTATDGEYLGISTQEAYDLLENRSAQNVVVAVLDSGIDLQHEDLDDVMWVNMDEIAGNGIDDDQNGYIDDVNGWNFIGGPDGENVSSETLEETRIYANADTYKGDHATFTKAVKAFVSSRESSIKNLNLAEKKMTVIEGIENIYSPVSIDSLKKMQSGCIADAAIVNEIIDYMENGGTFKGYKSGVQGFKSFAETSVNYYYNPDFEAREIIKDHYFNQTQKYYGNNDSEGPGPSHGTHVAGIIAAERNNNLGMDGIADKVKIMSVRVVPNGDERDKDVANAIRYAVDNGAKVINMSFGKAFSWNKQVVDDAVRYACKKDVLLVHAAGNSAKRLDGTNNFPNGKFEKKKFLKSSKADNWIEVGASTYNNNENLVASFSNYDSELVDIFAPGYQIYSSTPNDNYSKFNGTSMASPMVAGVAGLLRSYFPKLSAKEVKKIILESATPIDLEVKRPGDKEMVAFKSLSRKGAVLNAKSAVMMALKK